MTTEQTEFGTLYHQLERLIEALNDIRAAIETAAQSQAAD
jgi:hypothetical protein